MEIYTCPKCFKAYQNRCSVTRHLRYECGMGKYFRCMYCSYNVKQKYNLILHVGRVHPEKRTEFIMLYKNIKPEMLPNNKR